MRYGRIFLALAVFFALAVALRAAGLRVVVLSSSSPRGLYWSGGAPVRGQLAEVCLPAAIAAEGVRRGFLYREVLFPRCPDRIVPVMKRWVGQPGDTVGAFEDGLYVNGRLVRSWLLPADHPPLVRTTVLSAETLWLDAPGERSWDSRYYGPVPRSALRRHVAGPWLRASPVQTHGPDG